MALQYTALGLCVNGHDHKSMILLVVLAMYVLSGCIPCEIPAIPIKFQTDLLQVKPRPATAPTA